MPKRVLLPLCLLVLAGCLTAAFVMRGATPRSQAKKVLLEVGPESLRDAAARLYKNHFASRAPDYSTVKESLWPPQFNAFKPNHVGAYRDGFALALTSDRETEAGIYVIPAYTDFQPRVTERGRYERLADGVYWYSFDR